MSGSREALLRERIAAAIVGPGAMCRMTETEAKDIADEIMIYVNEFMEELVVISTRSRK